MHTLDILLVEDRAEDARIILRALKKAGITDDIEHVIDGGQALDFLGRSKPRLIIVDNQLPTLSGLEVVKAIGGLQHLRHIPVVMLTSSAEASDIETAWNYGVWSYVVKPTRYEEFTSTVAMLGTYWLGKNLTPSQ